MIPWLRLPYALANWAVAILFFAGLIVMGLSIVPVCLLFKKWPTIFWLWGNDESGPPEWFLRKGRPFPRWWWYAVRNPVANSKYILREPAHLRTYGEHSVEFRSGVQWRYRHSWLLDSFRVTWGDPRKSKGKKEFYIGWKIGSTDVPGVGFTSSFRPF